MSDGRGSGVARHGRGASFWLLALVLLPLVVQLPGCGGRESEARAPVVRETPQDEILTVATSWRSRMEEKGFRTPPSPITTFSEIVTSTLVLKRGSSTGIERLAYDGTFRVHDTTYHCQARVDLRVALVYGRHAGEAAVEVERPAAQVPRSCDLPGFPEPVLQVPAARARFALRSDRLVAFAPATDTRAYLPAS